MAAGEPSVRDRDRYRRLVVALAVAMAAAAVWSGMTVDRSVFASALSMTLLKGCALAVLTLLAVFHLGLEPVANVRAQRLLVVALVAETLCDIFITFHLVAGGLFSLLGMVFYGLTFVQFGFRRGPGTSWAGALGTALGLAAVFVGFGWGVQTLFPAGADGSMLGLYAVYMGVLGGAVGLSLVCRVPPVYRAAIVVFYVSDLVVYLMAVYGTLPALVLANGLLYYPAQVLFAYPVFRGGPGVTGRVEPGSAALDAVPVRGAAE